MYIAVTYENGNVFQHFGHTEQFKIYSVDDGKVVGSSIVDTNGSGHGALAGFLQEHSVHLSAAESVWVPRWLWLKPALNSMVVFRAMLMMPLMLFCQVIWLMILMQSAITTITKQDTNAATMAVVAETVTSKSG